MTILLSALAFFLLLSVLILIHELGHFLVARWAKVTVEEFGFGLPPRARTLFWGGGTRFSLNWIPFGGFVRLKGENAMTESERRARGSFSSASIPARIAILVAGVFMNFLLAMFLLTYGFSAGRWIPTYFSLEEMQSAATRGEISLELGVLVNQVLPDGAAASADLPVPSLLVAVDGAPVTLPDDVAPLQEGKRRVTYSLLTGEGFTEEKSVTVTLADGKAGVVLSPYARHIASPSRDLFSGIRIALRESRYLTVQTVLGIGSLISSLVTSATVPDGITGVVGIAQLTHASVQGGFGMYLRLVALLSLSLAILNILPFPALDGGRLLFVLLEFLWRRPMNRRFEMLANALGFGFLLLLIVFITFHDIARLF